MRHADEEELALAALGEDVDPAVRDHLATCQACAAELASLRRVVGVARVTTPEDVPAAPSPAVWERVRDELGLAPHVPSPAPALTPESPLRAGPSLPAGPALSAEPTPAAVPLRPPVRRRVPVAWVGAAAAAGLVLGAVAGGLWAAREPATEPSVLARATLDPLPGWEAAGTATVEQDAEGRRVVVVVDVDAVPGEDGFREVWLIASDLSGMVSLGVLEGSQGRFVLPGGLDLSRFPVVDVSQEPFDGDATHSGDSIVRGSLDV